MLTSKNWKEIYDECNRIIKEEGLTARTLIKNSNVELIGTTDNPTDSLEYHKQIAEDDSFDVKVLPLSVRMSIMTHLLKALRFYCQPIEGFLVLKLLTILAY